MSDGSRLPELAPGRLDGEQKELYDVFAGGQRQSEASYFPVVDRDGILSGPYRAMLLSPTLGRPLERLGRAVRYEAAIPGRVRELTILTVALATENEVEWAAHEGLAAARGVPEETIATLRDPHPAFVDSSDELVHRVVRSLLTEHSISDELFRQTEDMLGTGGVFELVVTAGYYQTIAHINTAFALRVAPSNGRAGA